MHLKHHLSAIAAVSAFLTPCMAAYSLKDDYTTANFFNMFTFFTDDDPTHGYVDYISQSAASSAGLINTNNNQIYMGVDTKNVASGRGRKSVRITSKAVYNHALIILDLAHMPGSVCGTWPAFWTVGPNWPTGGEIDIIEGVNTQSGNSMALHTGPGCSVSSNTSPNTGGASNAQALFSGTVKTPNCDVAASGQATNAGCAITTSDSSTYGSGLNAANGGVYATEWNSNVIRIWYFRRGSIPNDISSGSPSPSSWGSPMASWSSASCNIDKAFTNQQIVFDTTFCGDWAGSVWSTDATCSKKASTCQNYVQNNPQAFTDSFWSVNSLKVYTGADGGNNGGASPTASVSQPISSGIGTGKPPVGTVAPSTSATGISVPGVSTGGTTGKPQPIPTASNSIPAPQPSVPAPTYPTTMSTSSRNWGNGGYTQTQAWTRTREGGWNRGGGPPRMAQWAGGHINAVSADTEHFALAFATATAPAIEVELTAAFAPQQTGDVSESISELGRRSLISPVERRRDVEDGTSIDDIDNEPFHDGRRARRSHLARHKDRRHGA